MMKTSDLKSISENLIDTFNNAGKASIDLYEKGLKIDIKEDNSPVTNGDIKVNEIITNKIKRRTILINKKSHIFYLLFNFISIYFIIIIMP